MGRVRQGERGAEKEREKRKGGSPNTNSWIPTKGMG